MPDAEMPDTEIAELRAEIADLRAELEKRPILKAGNCIRIDDGMISFSGTLTFECNGDGTANIDLKG